MQTILQNVSANGVFALDLVGEPAKGADFAKTKQYLQMNYGVEYPREKFDMLFEMIAEEGWSQSRLAATLKWFLKNKKFAAWVIADWFEYGAKLFPFSWYREQLAKGVKHEEMESYIINGVCLWKMKDGQELPFERLKPPKQEEPSEPEPETDCPEMKIEDLVPIFDIKTKLQETTKREQPSRFTSDYYLAKKLEFEADLKKQLSKEA